jgi:glycosyltransferase involved in cell wall biosynthesis
MLAEKAIRNCDRIIAISKSTGDDLAEFLGVAPDRIKLVYPGIFEEYRIQDQRGAAEEISLRYGVEPRYMAAVGTVEPRKNLSLLVRVLQLLKRNGRLDCPLLIAGTNGWKNSHLFEEVRESGLTEQEIRFLGYIPSEDLPRFYGGAQVFLFPSLYEGFGIPPLEAMACGTPVIASNARPMGEVLGDAAILEPPWSVERFAEAISRVLADENVRCRMRTRGINRVRAFRREASVRQLLRALS